MLLWKAWAIHTESMTVVVKIKAHEADSACVRANSRVRERVILGEGGGGGMDSNPSVCET